MRLVDVSQTFPENTCRSVTGTTLICRCVFWAVGFEGLSIDCPMSASVLLGRLFDSCRRKNSSDQSCLQVKKLMVCATGLQFAEVVLPGSIQFVAVDLSCTCRKVQYANLAVATVAFSLRCRLFPESKRIHRTASRLFPIQFQRPIPMRAVVAVAARSQNASSLEWRHAFAGEFIGALVFWVTGMALDPVPVDFVPGTELVEALP